MPTYGNQFGDGRVSVYDPAINPEAQTNLWKNCPLWEYHHDGEIGVLLDEGFVSYNAQATTGDYTLTQATAGSAAISTAIPGTLAISAGSATAGQGANVQRLKSGFLPAANKSIWFEAKISLTAGTPPVTKWQGFIGLAASDTTILPSGALTGTVNAIGWYTLASQNLALTFWADKAGTNLTRTGTTLVAATNVRLGFFYSGTDDTIQQYINGVATGAVIPTANIPKAAMIYPSFVCQSDGTDQPILNVQSYRVFQLR